MNQKEPRSNSKLLKIILPLGLFLIAISAITINHLRNKAEANLKKEQTISNVRNEGIQSGQQADNEFENRRRQAQIDDERKRKYNSNN